MFARADLEIAVVGPTLVVQAVGADLAARWTAQVDPCLLRVVWRQAVGTGAEQEEGQEWQEEQWTAHDVLRQVRRTCKGP
ncbi:hypothetical protein D3C72_2374670 [compost metagenome]